MTNALDNYLNDPLRKGYYDAIRNVPRDPKGGKDYVEGYQIGRKEVCRKNSQAQARELVLRNR